ncbi:MAG: hypothetical protein WA172_04510 [Terriglobales bacterium]
MPLRDGDSAYSFDEVIVALLFAVAAAFVAFAGISLASIAIGMILQHLRVLTDEGGAWFGISVGIPCGVVVAPIVFFYAMRYKLKRGRPRQTLFKAYRAQS